MFPPGTCQVLNIRYPSHLLPCGEKTGIWDLFKSISQELASDGDFKDEMQHGPTSLGRHLLKKGLWIQEPLSSFVLCRLIFLTAVHHLTDGLSWCSTKPEYAPFCLHHSSDCSWQEWSLSPLLFFPPVPSPRYFSGDMFSEELRAVAHGWVWCAIFFFPQRHQRLPKLSLYRAVSFHTKVPWGPAVTSGRFLYIFALNSLPKLRPSHTSICVQILDGLPGS